VVYVQNKGPQSFISSSNEKASYSLEAETVSPRWVRDVPKKPVVPVGTACRIQTNTVGKDEQEGHLDTAVGRSQAVCHLSVYPNGPPILSVFLLACLPGSAYVAQASLELTILLPPKCSDYRHAPPYPACPLFLWCQLLFHM
jgi:hypothetical protein